MDWLKQFDDLKTSVLKELANVGISNAAVAVGEITGERIDVPVPQLSFFSKQKMLDFDKRDGTFVGAYLTVEGISMLTETLILFPKKDALELMDKFINADKSIKVEMEKLTVDERRSIFSEIATVIAATYFSAVGTMFNFKIKHDVPQVSFEQNSLFDFMEHKLKQKEGVSIDTSFISAESKLQGNFLLIPDPNSLDILFKQIGLV